jgi:hypothetical protein
VIEHDVIVPKCFDRLLDISEIINCAKLVSVRASSLAIALLLLLVRSTYLHAWMSENFAKNTRESSPA